MKNALMAILGLCLSSGCVFLAGAAVGAGVVHAVGEDTVEVILESDFDTVFAACLAELEAQGKVDYADDEDGRLTGEVDDAAVEIEIDRAGRNKQRVTVTARRIAGFSPDLESAQEVADGIAQRFV